MALILYAYPPSVYCRIVRMMLHECGQVAEVIEVDPFSGPVAAHPFNRVPVLDHDGFVVYETAAILSYLDATFANDRLTPTDPRARTRMVQVQAIIDAHGYWPLVRQVFAHRVFRPLEGLAPDEAEIAQGLAAAETVLKALDRIAAEGLVLTARELTLADVHLAPMIGAFAAAPEGARLLAGFPALAGWWGHISACSSYLATR